MPRADELLGLRGLGRLLDEAFVALPFQNGDREADAPTWVPARDVIEDSEGIKIVAEVPGVKPEDVKISLENNVLTIRGEKKQEAEATSDKARRYERSYGLFERTFALPDTTGRGAPSAPFSFYQSPAKSERPAPHFP